MPSRPDIVFALVGDVRRNTRALKQLRSLADLGLQTTALTLGPPADEALFEPGIRVRVLPQPTGSGPRFFWRAHRTFRRAALDLPARSYFASDLFVLPGLAAAARRHDAALVYDARELYPFLGSTAGKPWAQLLWYLVERRYAPRADAVFTVSASIADEMARLYGIAPPVLVENVPPFQQVASDGTLRARAGLPDDAFVALYQGGLKPGRGCGVLLQAAASVPQVHVVFLGDGPARAGLQLQAQRLGIAERVRFLEPVHPDDLLPVTAGADLGVSLIEARSRSLYLSLPNKLFEYLMAGVPVLASDFPEIGRVVRAHEVGLVVDPAAPEAVAEALRRAVEDDAARAAWRHRTREVFETYSWEAASNRLCAAYQHVLAAH